MYSVNPSIYSSGQGGPPGQPGKPGNPGKRGPTGPRGERGYGEKGKKGDDGEKGDTGPTGILGPTGIIGPTGDGKYGHTGPTGINGPTGLKGDFGGPTGEQGQLGPIGPTGPAGDNLIQTFYQETTLYHLKIMSEFNKINNSKLYITGSADYDGIDKAILHLQYTANINNYIESIVALKDGFKIIFQIKTSKPIKLFYMSTMGNTYSIPISYSSIEYIDNQFLHISFDFDSLDSLSEYMYPAAIYQLYIYWF